MHVLHGDGCAHEAEQPPIQEALGIDLYFLNVLMKIEDMLLNRIFDAEAVSLQVL